MNSPGLSRRGWRNLADGAIVLAATAFIVIGGGLIVTSRQGDSYLNASACARSLDALTNRCWAQIPVTLDIAAVVHHGKLGPAQPQVTITWPGHADHLTLIVPYPTPAFYTIAKEKPGKRVYLKVWNGIPTALYPALANGSVAPSAVRTEMNPLSVEDISLGGGLSLVGVGLALLVVHPVLPRLLARRRSRDPSAPRPRWETAAGTLSGVFSNRRLRVALLVLIALNLLDIATSIFGGKIGTYEGNPVAWAMVQRWGPLGGFLSLKLPALIAVMLAMTRLPQKIALVAAWAGCMVMLWIVLDNVQLAWNYTLS